MKETDAAYLAGLIDGDGYFGIYRRKGSQVRKGEWQYFVRIIGATTPALRELAAEFGAQMNRRNVATERRREIWTVQWQQRKAIVITERVLPYLRLKQEQGRILLQFSATFRGWCRMKPILPEVHQERIEIAARLHVANGSYGRPNHYQKSLAFPDSTHSS